MKLRHIILEMQIISRQFTRIQIFTLILLFPVLSELGILFLSDIKSAISVASFKYRLNRDLEKPPRYYNIGTRIGQILHARLRMECRALISHLYRKNIVPSPSCICCGFESPYHFLFVCSRYNVARNRYLQNNLMNYSTINLLFGMENEPAPDNETLFLQVQDFIINSRRFVDSP